MDEEQQYERFDMDNDFEGGEWMGGEYVHRCCCRAKPHQLSLCMLATGDLYAMPASLSAHACTTAQKNHCLLQKCLKHVLLSPVLTAACHQGRPDLSILHRGKRQKAAQTKEDRIYGVFADSDSDGDGGPRRKRKREEADYSRSTVQQPVLHGGARAPADCRQQQGPATVNSANMPLQLHMGGG